MRSNYTKIAEENLRKYGTEIERIGEMLLSHRYSDRTHFVYELLQNAEDAIRLRKNSTDLPRSVCFNLDQDHLEFTHYGLPFDEKHVSAICGIGESTKEDELTAIGHFGIGFKSVYAFSKKPEIHSGDEHFVIEAFVRPKAVSQKKTSSGQTLFCLPLSDTEAYQEILKRLQVLGHRTLLFLKEIDSIEWKETGGSNGIFLRDTTLLDADIRRITLYGESSEGTKAEPEDWLVFSRDVFKHKEEKAGQIELAFALRKDESGRHLITPVTDSPLVVFFPTEKETNLGFLVQGPYKTTPSRDNIPKDDNWNQYLVAETSTLVKQSLLKLREMDLLSVDAIRAMPLDVSKFRPPYWNSGPEHMFKPVFDTVKASFLEEQLIPRYKGGYISGKCAKIARTEGLRELFDSSQLTQLYNAENDLSWVTADVTNNRTPEVRKYLMQELDIDEVETDTLLPLFTENFFSQQSDDWIATFYAFLLDQPSLWRTGGFRLKPIIRVESGEQLIPFHENGMPKVFLPGFTRSGFQTVKQSVCKDPDALKFLRALGLTEPDPVDDVIVNVLPHFAQGAIGNTGITYEAAMTRILAAYQTDSASQKQKLLSNLSECSFVKSRNAKSDKVKFLVPSRVYFPTEKLRTVFTDTSNIWFVDEACETLKGEDQKRLLEACGVRAYLRRAECETTLNWIELGEMRRSQGAEKKSWHKITDYDVPGFCEAVKRISAFPPEKAEMTSFALWSLLLDTLREGREGFFKGNYRWGYVQSSWENDFPAKFVRELTNIPWIPTIKKGMKCSVDVCFSEVALCIQSLPSPFLQNLLRFQPEVIIQLAEQTGIDVSAIELLKKHGITGDQLLDLLRQAGFEQPATESPSGSLTNPGAGAGDGNSVLTPGKDVDGSSKGSRTPTGDDSGPSAGGSDKPGDLGADTQNRFFSYVYVSPGGTDRTEPIMNPEEFFRREKVGREGVDFVIEQVSKPGITVIEMPPTNEGYDLEIHDTSGKVQCYIEVKSTSKTWGDRGVTLSEPQFEAARRLKEKYWLFVVENVGKPDCRLHRIQNPAMKIDNYVFDGGWKKSDTVNSEVEDSE